MRVYELAKELGLDSKETLSRCRELDIPAKSHMSQIEEADIKKLKKHLKEKVPEAPVGRIEETRIKPSVIRRRALRPKKAPAEVPVEPEPKKKPAVKKKTKEPAEAEAKKKKAAKPSLSKVETAKKAAPAKEAAKVKKVPTRRYLKPSLRRTARAAEEIPSLPEKKVEVAKPKETEVRKKKKKGKLAEAAEEEKGFPPAKKKGKAVEAVPKKKGLRRKIAFKSHQGTLQDGMELIDLDKMYIPARKKPVGKKRPARKTQVTVPKAIKRHVRMGDKIAVSELARHMGIKARELLKKLSEQDVPAQINTELDYETASLIAHEFDYEVIQERFEEAKILAFPPVADQPEKLAPRPPVVTVMGHVDHGKTSLLDVIRKSRMVDQEAGGITQHIGASTIETPQGNLVFIDTPGHEAFTAMRARGAEVTDIVVLVVAADDGVMPQTIEAINHARAAGVPIIVAINKIDLANANIDAVKQKLTEQGLAPEEWGGETLVVTCSAKTGQGVNDLLDAIMLQAEMLELKADPDRLAEGVVIESRLDKGKGPIPTIIIQRGTLHLGQPVICGKFSGKIRAMINDKGQMIKEAGPGTAVEIIGLSGVPQPGGKLLAVEDQRKAKMVSEHRKEQSRQSMLSAPIKATLEDLLEKVKEGEKPKLNLIIKADTNGSVEAVKKVLAKVFNEKVELDILHTGVGGITENDVLLASSSQAIIIGFMVRPETKAQKLAVEEDVDLDLYQIIYDLGKDMEVKLKGFFKPEARERVVGHVEVRQVFNIPRIGKVAGAYVLDGLVSRNARARLLRDQVVIHEGKISSLKRFKDDAREVQAGFECGLTLENYQDIKPGDIIETFVLEEVPAE